MLEPYFKKGVIEAGCDEAGRGCLAGPVFAAAVILPQDFHHPLLNDSKQVTPENRGLLRQVIETAAVAWAVAMVSHEEIDQINILKAAMKGMHMAIGQLAARPDLLLIDGNHFPPYFGIVHKCVVKGDGKYASIAAASILAKTHRDEYMLRLHEHYPCYGWDENKGYGTLHHRQMIDKIGVSPYHRLTFSMGLENLEGRKVKAREDIEEM